MLTESTYIFSFSNKCAMQHNRIESGVQLFSRVNRKTYLEGINSALFPNGGPHHNQVIEITGAPEIDKYDLIIDFIVRCILPNKYNNEWKGSAAILINTDFQISLLKIIKVIETKIAKHDIKESKRLIIENALKNLIIFNCYTLEQLEMTFYYLENVIQSNANICLVAIDNISTGFWISSMNSGTSNYSHSLRNFEILYNVIKSLEVLTIFLKHDKTTKKRFSSKVDFRIEIEKIEDNYKAIVTSYENQSVVHIPFHLKADIEFLQQIS
ncbi:hypothetical protein NQ315_010558 [Exocentrus adspersus]|uniref:DNA recombination and repair protein Rad51-like C-terminal domain-containing protein n=1 Tax=Exocentrus adspersus TaxID=1586481 RepID=A0AAV8W5E7_9CUCU|nr:hypothetical protein NQ315_010558 [Exocentrus adspersus]